MNEAKLMKSRRLFAAFFLLACHGMVVKWWKINFFFSLFYFSFFWAQNQSYYWNFLVPTWCQFFSVCVCTMKKIGSLRSSYSLNHNTSTWCLQLILIAFLSMRKINSFWVSFTFSKLLLIFPVLFLLSLDRQIIIWTKITQKRKNF